MYQCNASCDSAGWPEMFLLDLGAYLFPTHHLALPDGFVMLAFISVYLFSLSVLLYLILVWDIQVFLYMTFAFPLSYTH